MTTKKYTLLAIFIFSFQLFLSAQNKLYWITFKDKNYNSYSVSKPQQFLSEKAIERRKKQNIAITKQDLPLSDLYIHLVENTGAVVLKKSKWFNAVLVKTTTEMQIETIGNYLFVKSIKEMSVSANTSSINKFETENTQMVVPQESFSADRTNVYDYGLSLNQANQIGVDCMHNSGFNGTGVVVAVLDAGFFNVNILPAFDSLRNNNQILGCRDFVTGDTLVYEDNQHGMMVLSSMGGNLPGRLVGTAPKAKYWLIRTEDAATETMQEEINWVVGAEFADSVGADIINSSLGYSYFDNTAENHTYADMDGNTTIITKAADWAASKGIFVCSSAGNSAGFPWFKITAPADADSILTVGAVDSAGFVTSFSSRGPTFDGRIKPNVAAKGYQSVVAAPWGDILQGNGTSFSSPITAGAVACLWQANSSKTNMELLSAIQQSANQATAPDTLIGYGIPNFCTANLILTGINENTANENEFAVFPNPFFNQLTFNYNSTKKGKVKILLFDVSGRCVAEQEFFALENKNTFTINGLDKLSKGIYYIQLTDSENTVAYKKIVKQ
jgi:hypothetical protein